MMTYVLFVHGKATIKTDNPTVIDENIKVLGPTLSKYCEVKAYEQVEYKL